MTEQRELQHSVSRLTLKIITYGRITGLPHIVEVRFVESSGAFFALAGRAESDWVLNALRSRQAKLRMHDLVYEATVMKAAEEERTEVLELFASKYGPRIIHDWYASSETCMKFTPIGPPARKGLIRGENEAELDYSDWSIKKADYYQEVAEAFDSASEEYDFTINRNFINSWIRRRSLEELLRIVKAEDVLVEIGCGTGAEAVLIAPHVSKIIATDISARMLELLSRKIEARRLGKKIIPVRLRASDIAEVGSSLSGNKVRIAYSFNGALNCEPHLEKAALSLSTILERGGYLVCSIRNTLCLSEFLAHALVFQFEKMTPRKKQPVMVSVGGIDIPSTYYPPSRFAEVFSPYFTLKKQIALPGLLPPAYLNDYYLKFRPIVSPLERAELLISKHFPVNRFGDQTLFIFQKK